VELWIGIVALVAVGAAVWCRWRTSRPAEAVLRIEVGRDAGEPLTVVNAGRDTVFDLEATLRFEPRAGRPGRVLERHRRVRVLLPGERLAFPFPEDATGRDAARLATLVRRVSLDAVGVDAAGRHLDAQDALDDPLSWMGSRSATGLAS
jgi:hypothetical protein